MSKRKIFGLTSVRRKDTRFDKTQNIYFFVKTLSKRFSGGTLCVYDC